MAVRDAFRAPSRAARGPTQGTMGGPASGPAAVAGPPGKRAVILGDEVYLWILIAAELAAMAWLRATFSRYHGG